MIQNICLAEVLPALTWWLVTIGKFQFLAIRCFLLTSLCTRHNLLVYTYMQAKQVYSTFKNLENSIAHFTCICGFSVVFITIDIYLYLTYLIPWRTLFLLKFLLHLLFDSLIHACNKFLVLSHTNPLSSLFFLLTLHFPASPFTTVDSSVSFMTY